MNNILSEPTFDSVLKIDSRLAALQEELKDMEKEYGFS
jgi:hypothetical protein